MLKIRNPFKRTTNPRIARRLDAIRAPRTPDIVTALEQMLSEDRTDREAREIGLISFGRFAAARRR